MLYHIKQNQLFNRRVLIKRNPAQTSMSPLMSKGNQKTLNSMPVVNGSTTVEARYLSLCFDNEIQL